VEISGLTKAFDGKPAVAGVDLVVREGEILVLLGPSGCGKTTTMRAIVGLEQPDSGRISIAGRVVYDSVTGANVPANRRGVAMVFQSYAIWPHMTVRQNVAFPLTIQKVPKREARQRVDEMLELLGLTDLAARPASLLSGGQMQRVALARSLTMQPKVLVLDEPLSNLDAQLRERLRLELRELHQSLHTTSVYVTHDQHEALALADRIGVMQAGQIIQLTDPVTLYRHPARTFVAEFLGGTNFFPGTVVSLNPDGTCRVRLDDEDGHSLADPEAATVLVNAGQSARLVGDRVTVSIRPEVVGIRPVTAPPAGDAANVLAGTIDVSAFMGDHAHYVVQTGSGLRLQVKRFGEGYPLGDGTKVNLTFGSEAVFVFDEEGMAWR